MSLEGQQLGRYRLQHLLGSGGMGEVYLATDASLNRQVAIKVIRAEAASYPEAQAAKEAARLFQRELRTIAALDHPHILPLFDSGEESAGRTTLTYMVMPYRKEGSLADWLHQRKRAALLSPADVEHVVQQAASALQHAHSQQIIHQDVKPSNFLLRSREQQPERPDVLLADFGVAKFISATSGMSQASRGTPSYMAPEQWEGRPVPATDQYALAVMAYELLTGRPPFQGGMAQLMYQHFHVPPPPPSTHHPHIPQALDAVLLRALAKRPEERFPSIVAFAEAFGQAVQSSDAPTVAKPPPVQSRDLYATLAISQQEALTGTSRALTLPGGRQVTVTIPAGSQDGKVLRVEGQGEASDSGRVGALVLTLAIAPSEAMAPLSEAQQAEAQTFLSEAPPVPPTGVAPPSQVAELPSTSGPSSESLQLTELAGLSGRPPVPSEAAGPSITQESHPSKRRLSRRAVIVGLAGITGLAVVGGGIAWLANSQRPQASPPGPQPTATQTPTATLKNLLYTYHGHSAPVKAVGWSPNGTRIASGSDDWTVQVWDATSGGNVVALRNTGNTMLAVAWSLDGKRIAAGERDAIGNVYVLDAISGSTLFTFRDHSADVRALAWSPNSKRIASAYSVSHHFDSQGVPVGVLVWNAADGSQAYNYKGHAGNVNAVAWSHDGTRIASGGDDNTVQVWDAVTGNHLKTYTGHSASVNTVAWSPDGKRIASASDDTMVQVWDSTSPNAPIAQGTSAATPTAGNLFYTYTGHSAGVLTVAWSPDGKRIASGSADKTVQVWNAADGSNAYTYRGHTSFVNAVAWSPDGSKIASASDDHTVQVWQGG